MEEEPSDATTALLDTLAVEARIVEGLPEEEQEEQVRLENGWHWAPKFGW